MEHEAHAPNAMRLDMVCRRDMLLSIATISMKTRKGACSMMMLRQALVLCSLAVLLIACTEGAQFTGWQTEEFSKTLVTQSRTKTFVLSNPQEDQEQHVRAIAFDRGSNAAGHFRIDKVEVGGQVVPATDIVIPPGSALTVTVTYAPTNLEASQAAYNDWVTGAPERWIPKKPEDAARKQEKVILQRSIIEVVYDFPTEGIYYVQLVGEAKPGPNGEEEAGGAFAACTPGDGIACYTGGFAVDIPQLAPGGPKALTLTGPIKLRIDGGSVTLRMDDFPYAIMMLRSSEIPQLPSGVSATLVISGAQGAEATGTFDGTRITLEDVAFRIRVALGELTLDQIKQGISALVDFEVPNLKIETIKPLSKGAITMHMETALPQNPSGNELFDQFLSGAQIVAIMEGELAL